MKFYKITEINDIWYNSFYDIYSSSFPKNEQRNKSQQIKAFKNNSYNIICYTNDNQLISFIAYWEFNHYVYIEHLAVNPKFRGQNIGSIMLNSFAELIDKKIILEIDPPKDEISKKRLKFYQNLGYKENSYIHFHPPYIKNYAPHELIILSLNETISLEEYLQFHTDLENLIMNFDD